MKIGSWAYVPGSPSKSVHDWGCVFGGFSESAATPIHRLELPAAATVIILCCGEPITLKPALTLGSTTRLSAFCAGLQIQAQCVAHAGINDCVEIRLPPLASYAMFGGVVTEVHSAPINLFDIAPQQTGVLLDRLSSTGSWQGRLAAVDNFLARGFAESTRRIPAELSWAWQTLERSHGQTSIAAVARAVGWSERHLVNRFVAYFGVRPKALARRLRFSHAYNLVAAPAGLDFSTIAVEVGYSDQSHMIREFQSFSGLTPAALRVARFNDDLPGIPAAAILQR